MSKGKACPTQKVSGFYFRDRAGKRTGLIRREEDIRWFLRTHAVAEAFFPGKVDSFGFIIRPEIEFVMENEDFQPVSPAKWLEEKNRERRKKKYEFFQKFHRYDFRDGPVPGIRTWSKRYFRKSRFGQLVADAAHFCREDGEPPVRSKRKVARCLFDEERFRTSQRSWKNHRKHQWR